MARQAAARPARRGGGNWLSGLACGALLTFATGIALLAGVLLAPALLSAVVETTPGRPVTRAVGLCGVAMVLRPGWHLVMAGSTTAAALDVLSDPLVIGAAWLACLFGWALCELVPVAMRIISDMQAATRIAALTTEEAALRAEWDLD